jgi:hypothetical protein
MVFRIARFFNILVMVRAAALVTGARMAGRATLVPMEAAKREATMRAEAIVMELGGDGGERWWNGR